MNVDTLRDALLKVAANMPAHRQSGDIFLEQLFERGIVERPRKREDIYQECELAAAQASAETLKSAAPIRIVFVKGGASLGWQGGSRCEKYLFQREN